ncbi:hypothetical protein K438DRAFT_1826272, partial [Mycena galopus ATCC 62051]
MEYTTQVPHEVLSEIFLFVVESRSFDSECKFELDPPWLLGHICHRCRFVALTTPRLWCSLVLSRVDSLPISCILSIISA